MSLMVDGVYYADDNATSVGADGRWRRSKSVVRHWITQDGSAGPTGEAGVKAEAGR